MRKFIIPLIFTGFLICYFKTNAEEIKFLNSSWEQVKKQAKKSNKYIFVDAYTDWCGWCKVMDKETFTNKEVIDFMEHNFIPVKYEMEEGIGKKLAMKYRVWSFPTQLFFNPEGKLVFVSSGYQKPREFIETLKKVLNPKEQTNFRGISDNIDLPYPEFYKSAFAKNGSPDKKFPDSIEVNSYLDKQKDLFSEVNWCVIAHFKTNEKCNDYFLQNLKKYEELYGKKDIRSKLYSIIYSKYDEALKLKSEEHFSKVITMIDQYDPENAKKNKIFYQTMYFENTGDWKKYSDFVDEQIKTGNADNERINEFAWTIYEKADDTVIIGKAIAWLKPIIAIDPNYQNLDTYAALNYKIKNFKEAKIYAEKAIELGKKNNDNVDATVKLLEKINSNK